MPSCTIDLLYCIKDVLDSPVALKSVAEVGIYRNAFVSQVEWVISQMISHEVCEKPTEAEIEARHARIQEKRKSSS
jgi:hypothetical protein